MINIKTLYDLVIEFLDKNNGKFITEDEFNKLTEVSQLELFDECIGATNKLLDRKTFVAYGRSQNTDKRLEPFRDTKEIAVVDGEVTLPPDCEKISTVLTSLEKPKALKRIDEDRLGMVEDNPLREPNEDDIYYLEEKGSLMILGNIPKVVVKYLKTPKSGKYVTKEIDITVGNRTVKRKVFDETLSVNLEWNNRETLDLVNRIVQKITIPTRDAYINQAVQVNKNNE